MFRRLLKNSLPAWILLGILLGTVIKLFVLDVLSISGSSMLPTFKNGSSAPVFKLAYGLVKPFRGDFFVQWAEPQKDDIVIFLHDNKIVIKRVVLVSGEQLDFSADSEYSLLVQQKAVPLTERQYRSLSAFTEVPHGFVLVLGDNPEASIDSRDYGFVSVKNITGKILGK